MKVALAGASTYIAKATSKIKYSAPVKYSALAHLKHVWNQSPDNGKTGKKPGIDGVSASSFKADLPSNLEKIRDRLLNQDYEFQPLKSFFIDKGNGKERVICIPTVRDRLVQRLIAYHIIKKFNSKENRHVDKFGLCNSISFGIRGDGHLKAIDEALKRRTTQPWVLKTDIQSFFDSISRSLLLSKIQRALPKNSSLVPLFEQVVNCEIAKKQWQTNSARLEAQGLKRGTGLRQGMPLSPLLSNFFLGDFDRAIAKQKINMIRYADDLIVFCESEQQCRDTEVFVREQLAALDLGIPPLGAKKTFIAKPEEPALFLGVNLQPHKNGYVKAIPENTLNKIFERQSSYKRMDYCLQENLDLTGLVSMLKNQLQGYKASYVGTENLDYLVQKHLKGTSETIEYLLKTIFGESVLEALDENKRKFLGLPLAG